MCRTKKRIFKTVWKNQVICTGSPVRILLDFSLETLKVKRAWEDDLQFQRDQNYYTQQNYQLQSTEKENLFGSFWILFVCF